MTESARVLIVDDKKLVRETVRDTLYGFDCVFADAMNGMGALTLIESLDPDVIFLDLKLQDMSGLDVLRAARLHGVVRGKVIILTGFPEDSTKAEAEELGVFAYLTKPINWKEVRGTFASAAPQSVPAVRIHEPSGIVSVKRREQARAHSRAADASRPHILVLDDNTLWLESMEELLGKEFNLTLTTSVKQAARHVRRNNYALVVLDMRLPDDISGLDVLERMRKAKADLRAIVLTENPDYESAIESVKRGALDYVSKADSSKLTDIIHQILAEPPQPIRVFLSYEKTDRAKVTRIYQKLMERGFLPWMDYKSIVGGKWEPRIRREIATTDFFVFCLSPNSIHKEGPMRKEVRQALDRQEGMLDDTIFFITARLEECDVAAPFDVFQYFDVFKREGFTRLVRALSSKRKKPD